MEKVKFKSFIDEALFRKEFLASGLSLDEFLIKKREIEFGLTDWERSQRQKANWRKYRWKYLKGIRRFHKSTEGKRFHKNLARWLATRDPDTIVRIWDASKEAEREERGLTTRKAVESLEMLIAVCSGLTHALIEKRYFPSNVNEEVEYNLFLEEYIRVVKELLEWLEGVRAGVDVDFVIALVHPDEWKKVFEGVEISESFVDEKEEEGDYVRWLVDVMKRCKVKEEGEERGEVVADGGI